MTGFRRPEPIGADHEIAEFDCGSEAQTAWLREYAVLAHRAGSSRVFVACRSGSMQVAGYYALAAGEIERESAPERVSKGLGRHAIPVVILTRLGVDTRYQGQSLGRSLVHDALLQTAATAERIGVRALLIHAETAKAAAFYGRITSAFLQSPSDPLHIMLLMKDLRAALRQSAQHGT